MHYEHLVVLLSIRFSPSYHEVAENFKYSEEFSFEESIGDGHFSQVLRRARCGRGDYLIPISEECSLQTVKAISDSSASRALPSADGALTVGCSTPSLSTSRRQ